MPGFLIEYHRKRGDVRVERFDSLVDAMKERLDRDQRNRDDDLEIVTVSSRSQEQLQKSHSRYFVSA